MSGQPWRTLHELTVALEAAERREPYPRLAALLNLLTAQPKAARAPSIQAAAAA